jgi:hypothetical protein
VEARSAQQQHEAWMEDHHELGRGYSEVARELALRSRQRVAFAELEQPAYLTDTLGPVPESVRGRRAWRQAMLCVHDTQITWGEVCVCVCVDNVPVLTPAKLLALLRSLPAHMDDVGVLLLAEHARHQLHPA